jgi:hemerythrin-like domain-containing protein
MIQIKATDAIAERKCGHAQAQKNDMETISSYLAHDHARCDALFAQAQSALEEGQWPQAARAFACFGDALERHLLVEERIVFPAYEKAIRTASVPASAMRTEHLRIRGIVQRLAYSIEKRQEGEAFDHAGTLRSVLDRHDEIEQRKLYPMVERVLAGRQEAVIASMYEFGAMDTVAKAA